MKSNQPSNTLCRFFSGLSEQVFQTQLGVADPPLTDYLSELLVRFLRFDSLHRVRNTVGKPARYIGEMLCEADARLGEARRDVHRHIGDFALFWAGLYPESLRRHQGKARIDQFEDYCAHGKRAYIIASTIDAYEDPTPNDLLERLGHQFEMCAYGLREVRRQWESGEGEDNPGPLLLN